MLPAPWRNLQVLECLDTSECGKPIRRPPIFEGEPQGKLGVEMCGIIGLIYRFCCQAKSGGEMLGGTNGPSLLIYAKVF